MLRIAVRYSVNISRETSSELRDAVAVVTPPLAAPKMIEALSMPSRRTQIDRLPGMRPKPREQCVSLERCAELPLETHATSLGDVREAVMDLLRPWIWLAHARQSALTVVLENEADRILRFQPEGLLPNGIDVHAAPFAGGVQVWLSSEADLAMSFAQARDQALSAYR